MADNKLHMLLFDAKNRAIKEVNVEDELKEYYKLIDCTCIDIVQRTIGGKVFDIICDDEALLKNEPIISGVKIHKTNTLEPMLFGNLLFCHGDEETGELVSLSDDDFELLMKNFIGIEDDKGNDYIVMSMEY